MAAWSLVLAALAAALGIVGEFRSPINGDVAWLLHVAGGMLDGGRLYADFLETNPPLIVWLQLPVVGAARLADISPVVAYRVFIVTLMLASVAACARLLSISLPKADIARSTLPLAVAVVLLALPGPFFGQREHIALALALPYLIAASALVEGAPLGRGAQVALGAAAAIGFALKPPFLFVWVGSLAYSRWRGGRTVRAMDITVAVGIAVYGVAVVLLTPELIHLARMSNGAYLQYSRRTVMELVTRNAFALSSGLSAILYLAVRRTVRHHAIADHLAIAAVGFLLALVVQGKGYGYHYLPTLGASAVLLTLILSRTGDPAHPFQRATAVVCGACLLAAGSGLLLQAAVGRAEGRVSAIDREMLETAAFVRSRAAGAPVAVLSARLADAFPMVLYADALWPLRFPNLWFVQAYSQRREKRDLEAFARWAGHTVAEDLERRRPALILVRRPDAPGELDGGLDYLAFLGHDPTFARAFGHYRRTADRGPYAVYQPGP